MKQVKTLQDRMNSVKPYFRGIEMYNEAIMVKVVYPKSWKAYPSDDGKIKVTLSDDGTMTYYYADSNESTYDEIFDLIEQTVKTNQEVILKINLLKDKVLELKEIFQNKSYEELTTLKFVTDDVKSKKTKRKYTRKNKTSEKAKEEAQTEHNVAMEEEAL